MDIPEIFKLVCLAGIVLIPYMAIMAAFAIVGTQLKQQSAKRISKAQARGAFADLETPKNKFRFRFLAGVALFGLLGMVLSVAFLILQMVTQHANLYWVAVTIGLIFGGISAVAGFFMQREINRRL